ncbi:MAG: hypothetical protein K2H77_02195 [Alistipes sp.]|nr:hypothetical protein [Alistipes sp.]
MRKILTAWMALALCGTLGAQEYTPSQGLELPRGTAISYPTREEAAAATDRNNRYFTRLDEWTRDGNRLTARITVPFAWANRQVLLHVGRASGDYELRVNGRAAARNSNGSAPAEYNLTRLVREGANTLEIELLQPSPTAALESWKESSAPELGDTWLTSPPTMYIRDVLIKNSRNRATDDFLTAEVGIVVKTASLNPRTSRIYYELQAPDGTTAAIGHNDMTLDMRREDTLRFLARIPDTLQWNPEHPVRYTLRLKTQHEGREVEHLELRPGFRTVETHNGRLLVNGRPTALRTREIRPDAPTDEIEALRRQGCNTLRLLPGAAAESLYDACDSLGLYLIVTAPVDTRRSGLSRRRGGNPSNDPAWQEAYIERAATAYHTTKRHPSVIAFALARQSANGINLYETYLKMKRLDETRPFIYPDAEGEWNNDLLITE